MPTCAQGSSIPVMVNAVFGFLFLFFLVSSWSLVHMGSTGLAGLPVTLFGRRSVGALHL